MSIFYDGKRDMLRLKCDSCHKTVDLFRGQTDRLLAHDWIHEHGWKTMNTNKGWANVCPICRETIETEHRKRFIEQYFLMEDEAE